MTYSIFRVPLASLLKARAKKEAVEVAAESHTPLPGSAIKKQSRWLSYKELKPLKGISYSRIHLKRLEDDGKFPKRIDTGARVYWWEHEIDEWKQSEAAAR
jgi:prophage regulatory protein